MPKEYPVKWRFGVIDKLSAPIKKMTGSFAPITKAAKKANIQFKLMQRNTANLRNNLKSAGQGMSGVGKSMTVGLTAPIVAFGAATLRTAVNFGQSMNKVEALTKETGKSLNDMRELAKKLGSETAFSASQAADAMSFLGMAGFNANQILEATPALLDLAAASGTELARSADIASNILGAFGIKAKEMGRVADVLANTTASANVDMEMLAESMKQAAPIAKMYGLSLEETASAVGLLGNVGIQGSLAGNTLKNMMLNLAAPTSTAKKLFGAMGVAVTDSSGNMRKLNDILVDLGPALAKLPKSKQLAVLNEVFGKRAIAGAGELLTQSLKVGEDGKNAFQKFTDSINQSNGAANRMAKTMMKGAPGAIKGLSSAFEGLQIAIAESGLLDAFTEIVNKLASFIREISKTNPKFLKMASIAAVVAAALGPILVVFGGIVSIIPSFITGFNILLVLFGKFAFVGKVFAFIVKLWPVLLGGFKVLGVIVAALLTPVGALVAGIIALVAALTNLIVRWDKIKKGFKKGAFEGIKTFFGFGGDDEKKQIMPQNEVTSNVQGEPLGADNLMKKTFEFNAQKQRAQVDVNFANLPKESRVTTEDKESILQINTGMMGAL